VSSEFGRLEAIFKLLVSQYISVDNLRTSLD